MTEEEYRIRPGLDLAIIGMAGRFPGADNISQFWENLKNGVESIAFFSHQEMEHAGFSPGTLSDPNFVKARGTIDKIEYFDAFFFDYTPREAEKLDPQMRVFHECVWGALEDAGYVPDTYEGTIGLYAGASNNPSWESMLLSREPDYFTAIQYTDKDQMATRISHKLNLRGPSFVVETQCSTSLVAFHLACQGILSGECDMAVAGGITIALPVKGGYFFKEGMLLSPDGHCRTFDKNARGTVFGNGVGVVVLKEIEEAIADKDHIYAIVKGTAINNDGSKKISYSAPSVDGQAEVIRTALTVAQAEPESITFVETHGTATTLGDPIEINALKLAFKTDKKGYCAIGAVKSNLGHLDNVAGITSLIKTALALKHKMIPPSLHFNTPNPQIDFQNSPFHVNTSLTEWKNDQYPLRAGVSSFGIGGTNVHVILEEAPIAQGAQHTVHSVEREFSEGTGGLAPMSNREHQLILLSAKTTSALDKMSRNLAEHFKNNPDLNLADAAYTLQVGRNHFQTRRMMVCADKEEAIAALSAPGEGDVYTRVLEKDQQPSVVFMFPGQGSQYVNMGRELYQKELVFREEMDRCLEILKPIMGHDIKEILYPSHRSDRSNTSYKSYEPHINQTEIAQPVIFSFEYALARLLIKWGIKPWAMIGHSIGEYTAACLSGALSLQEALKIVALRGKLMQQLPTGTMLSIPLGEEELKPLLTDEIALAAVNTPSLCVVSGPGPAIDSFARKLEEKGHNYRYLKTSHAFHSSMMDPILKPFEGEISKLSLPVNKPETPYISNLTGTWVYAEDTVNPGYWATHLRKTVRFEAGLAELLKEEHLVFIEVGPGKTLSTFARKHPARKGKQPVIELVRHPKEKVPDLYYLSGKLGHLWLAGLAIDWQQFNSRHQKKKQRISLPTYPFDRIRCWPVGSPYKINKEAFGGKDPHLFESKDMAQWFYIPSWEYSVLTHRESRIPPQSCWLVFMDKCGFGERLRNRLQQEDHHVVTVRMGPWGDEEQEKQDDFIVDPLQADDYQRLFARLQKLGKIPAVIVHLWGITPDTHHQDRLEFETVEQTLNSGFYSLNHIARAIARENFPGDIFIEVVTNHLHRVTGEETLCPDKAALLAPVKIIPLEYPNITCRCIDILVPPPGSLQEKTFLDLLVQEVDSGSPGSESVVAYRGLHRWTQSYKTVPLNASASKPLAPSLEEGSVWVVLGGGPAALAAAAYLANGIKAKLMVITSPEDPVGEGWKKLETPGTPLMLAGLDVSDPQMIKDSLLKAREQLGPINGLIHAPVQQELELAIPLKRMLGLHQVLKEMNLEPDFFILFSSIGTAIYPSQAGKTSQCAANEFYDAFAYCQGPGRSPAALTVTIDLWNPLEEISKLGWRDLFHNLLEYRLPRVAISPLDLNNLICHYDEYRSWKEPTHLGEEPPLQDSDQVPGTALMQRQGLSTQYKAPENETQQVLQRVWQQFFGIGNLGIYDDFFELGGDSLNAMTLTTNIFRELGVKIPIDVFFSNPTMEKLAIYIINSDREETYSPLEAVEKKEYYLLSPAQKRILFMHELDPTSVNYNIFFVHTLDGEVDKKVLFELFAILIQRHESFRTTFDMIEGEPVQRMHEHVDFDIEYFEPAPTAPGVSNEPADQGAVIDGLIKNFMRPYELGRAPLLRVGMIKQTRSQGTRTIIMLDMHHIVSDGTSSLIAFQELFTLGAGKNLPPLRIQYKDYAEWFNLALNSEWMKQQETYWLKQFETGIPALNLPLDYERPTKKSFAGSLVKFEIEKEKMEQIKTITREENATVFMFLLSVYYLLLSKLSGQEDIVVVTITSGRNYSDLNRVIGMFASTLYLRNHPQKGKTFREFLKEIRTNTLKAYENQNYPSDTLVEKVAVNRDLSRNPISDVAFMFETFEGLEPVEPGTKEENLTGENTGAADQTGNIAPYDFERGDTLFDLGFIATGTGDNLEFRFEYITKLFKKETIQRLVTYYKEILDIVLENRSIKLKDIHFSSELQKAESKVTDIDFEL